MVARIVLMVALVLVALMFVPPLAWPMWLAHFVAIETCLVAVVIALGAAYFTDDPIIRVLALFTGFAGAIPALGSISIFISERQPFSILAWVSGGAVAQVTVERDVTMGPDILADVYRREGVGARPFVVVVHGGSWRAGDKGDAPRVSRAIADAGYVVFDIRYRLAPFPAGVTDIKCVLATVRAQAETLGVDPERGALLGRSAGGQLALVAAYSDDTIPSGCAGSPATVKAVIALYAPTDLAWAHANPFVPDVVDGTAALEQYLGGPPETAPEAYRLATPMTWIRPGLPRTLLIHGRGERCVRIDHAKRLRDALESAGQPVQTVLVPVADHGFDLRPGGFGEQLSRGVILDFLHDRV